MSRMNGQCHCGTVRVSVEGVPAADLPARACQCGFCRRHGAVTTSDPNARITISAPEGELIRYRFEQKLSEFLMCAHCGTYVGAVAEGDTGSIAIVNVRGVDLPGFAGREPQSMSYDGETVEARTARRKARWSPAVLAVIPTSA